MYNNIYISKELITQVIENKKLTNELKPDFVPWVYNQIDLIDPQANNLIIKINYRDPVIWQLDKENQVYLRYQDGKKFVDEKGRQVQTPNLIIQKTSIKVLDAIGRREIITLGQGEAFIFQRGILIQGTWQKLEKNKIPGNLLIIDKVSPKQLRKYFQKTKIYLQLSRHEGLPNSLCEAMLCCANPIGTNINGIPTAVGNTGYTHKYNVNKFTKKIIELWNIDYNQNARNRIINLFPEKKRYYLFKKYLKGKKT